MQQQQQVVGQLKVQAKDFVNTFWCDRLAFSPEAKLYALSVIGPNIQVKALWAMLAGNTRVTFETNDCEVIAPNGDKFNKNFTLNAAEEGYRMQRIRHSQGWAQLVATAEAPEFVSCMDEESIWRELTGDRYTTPLLRHWLPRLIIELKASKHLVKLGTFNCNCGVLTIEPEDLDKLVGRCVRSRLCEIV